MGDRLLFDSDVLIDYLREQPEAVPFVQGVLGRKLISAMTVAELYSGVRQGRERRVLDNFIRVFEVLPVTMKIAIRGGLIRRQYRPSHGTGLPDALIAATAEVQRAILVTRNEKHFPMLGDVLVPYRIS